MKDDSKDDDQTSEVGGDHDIDDSVNKDGHDEKDETKVINSTMDKMKGEIKGLLAKGNAEAKAKTKQKIKKLQSIL